MGHLSTTEFWLMVAGAALGSFGLRYSFIWAMDRFTLPPAIVGLLRYIPAAVLTALVAPPIFAPGPLPGETGLERPLAGVLAVIIAWRTKHMLLTIAGGMAALWLFKYLL